MFLATMFTYMSYLLWHAIVLDGIVFIFSYLWFRMLGFGKGMQFPSVMYLWLRCKCMDMRLKLSRNLDEKSAVEMGVDEFKALMVDIDRYDNVIVKERTRSAVMERNLWEMIKVLRERLEWVNLNDMSEEEFRERHKEVLECGVSEEFIGAFLCTMYYNNVMNSRSESARLVEFLGGMGFGKGRYDPFYCMYGLFEKLVEEDLGRFEKLWMADKADRIRMELSECR